MSAPQAAVQAQALTEVEPQAPTHQEIQLRAYELWQTRLRTGLEGAAEQDWFAAEEELVRGTSSTAEEQSDV